MADMRYCCCLAIAVVLSTACVQPQSALPTLLPAPTQTPSAPGTGERRLTTIFFNVRDSQNALIGNLSKDDFQISEDNRLQNIKNFRAQTGVPLALCVIIETSSRQTALLEMEKMALAQFLATIHSPNSACLVSFGAESTLEQGLTGNAARIGRSLTLLRNPSIPSPPPGSQAGHAPVAAIYDAIYAASDEILANEAARKAIVVFINGPDRGSRMQFRNTTDAAQKADSMVYVVLIAKEDQQGSNQEDLRRMAEETGGRFFPLPDDLDKLKQTLDRIGEELRNQYEIDFQSSNPRQDGRFRRIEIKAKGNYNVFARKGYYAPKP
jgi:VWFA-related protein